MPESPGPRARELARAARELLEADGPEGLSMRRLAERVGVTAPSVYKHFADKSALEHAVISEAFAELAWDFAAAIAGAGDPLAALGAEYRRFALAHPHLYRLMTTTALDRGRLVPGAEEAAAAPLVEAVGGDPDTARAVWAFAHGMALLEIDGRFPPGADLDAAWERGLSAFRRPAGH